MAPRKKQNLRSKASKPATSERVADPPISKKIDESAKVQVSKKKPSTAAVDMLQPEAAALVNMSDIEAPGDKHGEDAEKMSDIESPGDKLEADAKEQSDGSELGSEVSNGESESESENESDGLVEYKRNGKLLKRKRRSNSGLLMRETTIRVRECFWRVELSSGKRVHEAYVDHDGAMGSEQMGPHALGELVMAEMEMSPIYRKAISLADTPGVEKTSTFDFRRALAKKIRLYTKATRDKDSKTWVKRPRGTQSAIKWATTELGRRTALRRSKSREQVKLEKRRAEKKKRNKLMKKSKK
eukprot:44475_1